MIININPRKLVIWFLITLGASLLLLSCGASNKNKSSYDHKIDTSGASKSEKVKITQSDSGATKSQTNETEDKKESVEEGGVKAVFGKHDPEKVTGPVKINSDSSGGYSIDPGGRPLESVFLPKKKKTTETKKSKSSGSDSTSVKKKVTDVQSDSSGAVVSKQLKGDSKVIERKGFKWSSLIFPGLIIGVVLFLLWCGKKAFGRLNNG